MFSAHLSVRRLLGTAIAISALTVTAACGSATTAQPPNNPMPGTGGSGMPMPGMSEGMPAGDGLQPSSSGLTFTPEATNVAAGAPSRFAFRITGADGAAVTAYQVDQTKLLHFYLVRSDLTGFQHLHPDLAPDGTWSVTLPALLPGSYRAYAAFTATNTGRPVPVVVSRPITVPGPATETPLPAPSATTDVDGYVLALDGHAVAGHAGMLTLTVSKDGKPVTDLQPYLDTYAHLTAFHAGDLAFAHLHPEGAVSGDHGGGHLTFHAVLPEPGTYRMFVQFQTAGILHTAAITLPVS